MRDELPVLRRRPPGADDDSADAEGAEPENAADPSSAGGPAASRKRYWRDFFRWIRPHRREIVVIYGLALCAALMSLIMPRATMYIIDVVLPARDHAMLHLLGWALVINLFIQQSVDLLRNWRLAQLNARITLRLRQRLYDHLLDLPLHRLSELKTGGVVSRLSGDVDSVSGVLEMAIITPSIAATKIISTTAILFWISWQMSVAAVCLLPGVVLLNLAYLKRIRPIYRSIRRDRSEIDGRTVEVFGGIRVVRAFRREKAESQRYGTAHHLIIRKRLLANLQECFIWSGWGFFIPLAALVIIWYGGMLVLSGQATIGGIMAFNMYIMMLLVPVSTIVRSFGEMQQALAAMERVFDVLNTPVDKPDRPGARAAPERVETFEFDEVWFGYPTIGAPVDQLLLPGPTNGEPRPPAREEPVLRGFSLQVAGGTTVALVGPSGAGKTTVTNLVARFYDPQRGAVRVNGVDLRDIQLASYRRLLGFVQQDTFLFDGSVAQNIAYGRPGATRQQIEDAARRANAHEFIAGFAGGYDTRIGERGLRLSGGQAQRITIARALLADPRILILDEATSNLDSESEQLIQASLVELFAGRTTFIIAHRLSTVMNADQIVVLENGAIREIGPHNELMTRDGAYRRMVERQLRRTPEPGEPEPADWLA